MRRVPQFTAIQRQLPQRLMRDIAHGDYLPEGPYRSNLTQKQEAQFHLRGPRPAVALRPPRLMRMKGEGIPNQRQRAQARKRAQTMVADCSP